ncbi:MAG: bacterial transcriptional activator domain-containing protein [Firmicutes bacterium]|nr:bacterial transcriptional activator domain-containing protein [Bacillota bacterium]
MSENGSEKNVIYVKTLGSYSVSYNGAEIAIGARDESQIGLLMLLMFHFGKEGASRSLIKTTLFEDRDIEDVSHAIRNVLYNMRKNLKAHGLPDASFVKQSKGIYYWTDEVEVIEDAREFERLVSDALLETDVDKQAAFLAEACHSYSGRFFAGRDNVPWIYQEGERYRALFGQAVTILMNYYRQTHKFKDMYDLAIYAVNVDPFAEWEIYVVEALTCLGRFAESERYYEETVSLYIREYGDRSNEHVRDFIRRLGEHLFHDHETIDEIQEKLTNSDDLGGRGYYCSLPVFQELYQTIERTMRRNADKIFLMLCTIVDSKGNPMREGPKLTELSARLKTAAVSSVRHTDTVTKYGQGQYLILLINTTEENCHIIEKRINSNFLTSRQRTGVDYAVKGLIVQKENIPVLE